MILPQKKIHQMIAEIIADLYPDLLAMDPQEDFDSAIIGVCHGYGQEPRIAYDYDKVLKQLVGDGLTEEEASEHFSFNVIGSYVGPHTPVYIERYDDYED